MSDTRKPSDYTELREYLKEEGSVRDMQLTRRRVDHKTLTDLYLGITASPAGINLWELHDKFDVDVVYSWHDPTRDRLDMGLRLRK